MSVLLTKCKNCGKQAGEHKAGTHHCPGGRKHRTHGYQWFHCSMTFATDSTDAHPLTTSQAATAFIDETFSVGDETPNG